MRRSCKQRLDTGKLDHFARIHHGDPVGDLRHHAEIMGDEQDRHAIGLLELIELHQHLRLDRHVERRRRLVRQQDLGAAGERHGDHHALAHPARELVRIVVDTAFRRGNLDLAQQPERFRARLGLRDMPVDGDHLGDLLADRHGRVERGHRLLEDHRDGVAANAAHLVLGELRDIASLEHYFATTDPRAGVRQQAQDREGGHALAAARFTDDGKRLVASKRQRQIAHGRVPGAANAKFGAQIADRENRIVICVHHRVIPRAAWDRSHRATRRPAD
jgi:hypothetical protein